MKDLFVDAGQSEEEVSAHLDVSYSRWSRRASGIGVDCCERLYLVANLRGEIEQLWVLGGGHFDNGLKYDVTFEVLTLLCGQIAAQTPEMNLCNGMSSSDFDMGYCDQCQDFNFLKQENLKTTRSCVRFYGQQLMSQHSSKNLECYNAYGLVFHSFKWDCIFAQTVVGQKQAYCFHVASNRRQKVQKGDFYRLSPNQFTLQPRQPIRKDIAYIRERQELWVSPQSLEPSATPLLDITLDLTCELIPSCDRLSLTYAIHLMLAETFRIVFIVYSPIRREFCRAACDFGTYNSTYGRTTWPPTL